MSIDHNKLKSWPYQEARNILKKINFKTPDKGYVLFETGYGPSGLPHIGTFGEVARTSMIIKAMQEIAPDIPCKLLCFSDDMDGLRKVPSNLPQQEMLTSHLGKSLTNIPDPFSEKESFGHYMNNKLRQFLDQFYFNYEFASATEYYKSGKFNKALQKILENYDEINNLVKKTLSPERAKEYSVIMPICPKSEQVLDKGVIAVYPEKGSFLFKDSEDEEHEVKIGNGNCKLQWKADFALRWHALDVDFEMYGKDIIPSADLARKICQILGRKTPQNYHYELFLDENGEKISKSRGNGLTMEEWLRYAPHESLSYYMFLKPKTAKRLYFDVIPKAVDEYINHLGKFAELEIEKKLDSPIFFINNENSQANLGTLSFSLLLNLVSACNPENEDILWGFIKNYDPSLTPENAPMLSYLLSYALNYYRDFIAKHKSFREASALEKEAIIELRNILQNLAPNTDASAIQTEVYELGKKYNFELREWFKALYEILLGQSQGPRIGSFIALFGIEEMVKLIDSKVN